MFCVYRHTSPSGKVYIGISKSLKRRWEGSGMNYLRKNKDGKYIHWLFARAIIKYGWDNFKHEILFENLDEISAKLIEEDLIYYYKKDRLSYNVAPGGFSCTHINKGKSIVQLTLDLEIIAEFANAVEAGLSINASSSNITHAIKRKGQTHGFYWIYKSELSNLNNICFAPTRNNIVYQVDPLVKNVINVFKSEFEAAKSLNVTPSIIHNAIRRRNMLANYYWIKKEDFDNFIAITD